MNLSFFLLNLLSAPILFFILGISASLLKVNLVIPDSISKFLSLYLLLSIGFQGGYELHNAGLSLTTCVALLCGMLIAVLIPIYTFFLLRTKLTVFDSAAIAASFGSVSTVTFITAINFLNLLVYPLIAP